MADTKISGLTDLAAAPASGDLLVLDDVSDTTMAASGTNKKLTVSKFLKAPTLGEVAGDTLTVNAGIWTLGSNYVATRAAGALATGVVTLQTLTNTFSGDVGGATVGTGLGVVSTASGANSFSQVRGLSVPTSLTTSAGTTTALYGTHYATSVDGAGSATSAYGNLNSVTLTSTGNVTNAYGVLSFFTLSGAGDVTTGIGFNASAPTLSSTGAITSNIGFNAQNLGHATLVTNALGFNHADFTGAATLTVGFRSLMSSGTGKWGFQHNGTANNAFAGPTRFGSVVAPTETVHVTGTLATSGIAAIGTTTSSTTTLNLPLGATGVSPLRIAHGVAPTSPVNGDIWTTTLGLLSRVNGATVRMLTDDDTVDYKKVIDWRGAQYGDADASGIWLHLPGTTKAQAATNASALAAHYLDPADYAVAGLTTKYIVKAVCLTNATSVGTWTATVGLYPISAVAGTADILTCTTGTVTSGSTIAFANPTASTRATGNSGDFTAPAAGYYALGVSISGTPAADSRAGILVTLQVRNV